MADESVVSIPIGNNNPRQGLEAAAIVTSNENHEASSTSVSQLVANQTVVDDISDDDDLEGTSGDDEDDLTSSEDDEDEDEENGDEDEALRQGTAQEISKPGASGIYGSSASSLLDTAAPEQLMQAAVMMEKQNEKDLKSGKTEDSKPARREKKLSLLTSRFIEHLKKTSTNELDLTTVAHQMNVTKRRIYDVVNVLEGCNVVKKIARSKVRWSAPFPIARVPSLSDTRKTVEDGTRKTIEDEAVAKRKRLKISPGQPAKLMKEERAIESAISNVSEKIQKLVPLSTVAAREIRNVLSSTQTLLSLEMTGPAIVRVHAPIRDQTAGTRLYPLSIQLESFGTTTCGMIDPTGEYVTRIPFEPIPSLPVTPVPASQLFLKRSNRTELTQDEGIPSQDSIGTIDHLDTSQNSSS